MLNKLQKQVCRTVCPIPAVSLEPLTLTHSWSESFFYCYFFCRCSSKLGELIPFSALTGRWPIILIISITFLWPFINDISMSMSYALFACLPHIFFSTYDLNRHEVDSKTKTEIRNICFWCQWFNKRKIDYDQHSANTKKI